MAWRRPDLSGLGVAVLCARLAWNHPLPDGNKRAAWVSLREFCARNGYRLTARSVDDAVLTVEALAAHDIDEARLGTWIEDRLTFPSALRAETPLL